MEIYLREGLWGGWGVSLIALDSLAPLGKMTESCGDAASAVLQRKRRAGPLEGSPRRPPPRGALCPASQRPRPPPSQARCWARLLSPSAEEERGGNSCLREVRNTSLNVWCLLLAVGIQRLCARMGKGSTGSFLCPMFLTPARGCLWLKKCCFELEISKWVGEKRE